MSRAGRPLPELVAIYLSVFIASLATGLGRLALARYMRIELEASMFIVSSFTSWFMAGRALSSTIGGVVVNRNAGIGRLNVWLPILIATLVVYAISLLRNPLAILLLGFVWGLLNGFAWPMVQLLTSSLASRWSSTAMSVYFTVGGLGTSLGQYLYGILPLGNRDAVRLSAILLAPSSLLLLAASRRWPTWLRRGGVRGVGVGRLTGVEAYVLLSALTVGLLSGMLGEFLYVYVGEVFGLTRKGVAFILSLAGLTSLAASIAVGPAADRLGVARVLSIVLFSGAIGGILLTVSGGGVAAALAGITLARSASRSSLPLTRNAAVFSSERRASLIGLSNTLSNIGQMAGPLLAGWLYDNVGGSLLFIDLRGSGFLVASLLLILVAIVSLKVFRVGVAPNTLSSSPS